MAIILGLTSHLNYNHLIKLLANIICFHKRLICIIKLIDGQGVMSRTREALCIEYNNLNGIFRK